MATDRPWFPFYAKDWLDWRVLRMPLDAQGAYIRILAHMWADSTDHCSIEADPKKLARVLGIHGQKLNAILKNLQTENDPIFETINGRWYSKRLRQEAEKAEERSDKARTSARTRWDANAERTQCSDGASHSHSHNNNHKKKEEPPKSPKGDSVPYKQIADLWNSIVKDTTMPQVRSIEGRKKHLKARWAQAKKAQPKIPMLWFQDLFMNMTESDPFVRDAGWMTFDWAIKNATNPNKVFEGNYRKKGGQPKVNLSRAERTMLAAEEAFGDDQG